MSYRPHPVVTATGKRLGRPPNPEPSLEEFFEHRLFLVKRRLARFDYMVDPIFVPYTEASFESPRRLEDFELLESRK